MIKCNVNGFKKKLMPCLVSAWRKHCSVTGEWVVGGGVGVHFFQFGHHVEVQGTGYTWLVIWHNFTRETTIATACFLSHTSVLFWKRVYYKREEFAPNRNIFPSECKSVRVAEWLAILTANHEVPVKSCWRLNSASDFIVLHCRIW